jgi:hypothetical protein
MYTSGLKMPTFEEYLEEPGHKDIYSIIANIVVATQTTDEQTLGRLAIEVAEGLRRSPDDTNEFIEELFTREFVTEVSLDIEQAIDDYIPYLRGARRTYKQPYELERVRLLADIPGYLVDFIEENINPSKETPITPRTKARVERLRLSRNIDIVTIASYAIAGQRTEIPKLGELIANAIQEFLRGKPRDMMAIIEALLGRAFVRDVSKNIDQAILDYIPRDATSGDDGKTFDQIKYNPSTNHIDTDLDKVIMKIVSEYSMEQERESLEERFLQTPNEAERALALVQLINLESKNPGSKQFGDYSELEFAIRLKMSPLKSYPEVLHDSKKLNVYDIVAYRIARWKTDDRVDVNYLAQALRKYFTNPSDERRQVIDLFFTWQAFQDMANDPERYARLYIDYYDPSTRFNTIKPLDKRVKLPKNLLKLLESHTTKAAASKINFPNQPLLQPEVVPIHPAVQQPGVAAAAAAMAAMTVQLPPPPVRREEGLARDRDIDELTDTEIRQIPDSDTFTSVGSATSNGRSKITPNTSAEADLLYREAERDLFNTEITTKNLLRATRVKISDDEDRLRWIALFRGEDKRGPNREDLPTLYLKFLSIIGEDKFNTSYLAYQILEQFIPLRNTVLKLLINEGIDPNTPEGFQQATMFLRHKGVKSGDFSKDLPLIINGALQVRLNKFQFEAWGTTRNVPVIRPATLPVPEVVEEENEEVERLKEENTELKKYVDELEGQRYAYGRFMSKMIRNSKIPTRTMFNLPDDFPDDTSLTVERLERYADFDDEMKELIYETFEKYFKKKPSDLLDAYRIRVKAGTAQLG